MVEPERKGTVVTTKPKKRTLGTEKVSRKDPVTIYVENRTRGLIIECLEEGTQLDMMCDLWYEMKDDPFVVQSKKANETEKKYSDKIAKIIYTAFYDYAKTDPYVYDKLGLHSRILEKGEVPIVVIFEKEKKVALPIVHEFHAGYAFSEGQFPSFESVHVANYFNECGYSKGYIFVVTDYDPAGEDLYKQVQEKMNKFSNIDIETIWVKYGDEPTIEFGSYQLKNNKINKNWIDSGRERGVEFNSVIENHKSFHEGVRAEKEIIKTEYEAKRESLKAIAESGELSQEEIKAMYASYKESREAFRAEVEELHALKQADVEVNKTELVTVRKALISATKEADVDEEYISSLLDQIVELLEEHLEIDLYYYNLLNELRADNIDVLF